MFAIAMLAILVTMLMAGSHPRSDCLRPDSRAQHVWDKDNTAHRRGWLSQWTP